MPSAHPKPGGDSAMHGRYESEERQTRFDSGSQFIVTAWESHIPRDPRVFCIPSATVKNGRTMAVTMASLVQKKALRIKKKLGQLRK